MYAEELDWLWVVFFFFFCVVVVAVEGKAAGSDQMSLQW